MSENEGSVEAGRTSRRPSALTQWWDNVALSYHLTKYQIKQWLWTMQIVDWVQQRSADFSVWIYLHQIQYDNTPLQVEVEVNAPLQVLPGANDHADYKPPVTDDDRFDALSDLVDQHPIGRPMAVRGQSEH